jgi:hypothetical protein
MFFGAHAPLLHRLAEMRLESLFGTNVILPVRGMP